MLLNPRSACVLFDQKTLLPIVSALFFLFEQIPSKSQLNLPNSLMLYSILTYMRGYYIREDGLDIAIRRYLEQAQENNPKDVSMFCLDLANAFEKHGGVKYVLEEKIDRFEIDFILVDPVNSDKHLLAVDAHGYQHYFRNDEVQRGNTHLKKKIMGVLGIPYLEIGIMEWQILDDQGKKDFISSIVSQLFAHLEKKKSIENNQEKNQGLDYDNTAHFKVSINYCQSCKYKHHAELAQSIILDTYPNAEVELCQSDEKTGSFEISIDGELFHSKLKGDGFIGEENMDDFKDDLIEEIESRSLKAC